MDPRLAELFPEDIGFDIVKCAVASAGLEQRLLKELLLARLAA
jgi:hypothetical protein